MGRQISHMQIVAAQRWIRINSGWLQSTMVNGMGDLDGELKEVLSCRKSEVVSAARLASSPLDPPQIGSLTSLAATGSEHWDRSKARQGIYNVN